MKIGLSKFGFTLLFVLMAPVTYGAPQVLIQMSADDVVVPIDSPAYQAQLQSQGRPQEQSPSAAPPNTESARPPAESTQTIVLEGGSPKVVNRSGQFLFVPIDLGE